MTRHNLHTKRLCKRRLAVAIAALGLIALACTCTASGLSGGAVGGPTGNDGLITSGGGNLTVGGSQSASLVGGEAHNWFFEGQAGQQVTIRAIGHPPSPLVGITSFFNPANWSFGWPVPHYYPPYISTTDPYITLFDPGGLSIGFDDDSGGGTGGWDSLLITVLPADGTYTIRVGVYSPGGYTVSVN